MLTFPISEIFRRYSPRSLPPPRAGPSGPDSTALSCTTPTPTPSPHFSRHSTTATTVTGYASEPGAASDRGLSGGARRGHQSFRGRLPVSDRRVHSRRQLGGGFGLVRSGICTGRDGL